MAFLFPYKKEEKSALISPLRIWMPYIFTDSNHEMWEHDYHS